MLIDDDKHEPQADINPDALEEVFSGDVFVEEESVVISLHGDEEDEEVDEIDIAFEANDEGYW